MGVERRKMELNMEQILIKDIKIPEWSFKSKIDKKVYKRLENSIAKNGQTKNIIVRQLKDGKYEVVDGKIVFKILKSLNQDYIYCCVLKNISKKEAQLLYLEGDFYFEKNFISVAIALKKIHKKISKDKLSKTTNYDYKEIEELLTLAEYDLTRFHSTDKAEQSELF